MVVPWVVDDLLSELEASFSPESEDASSSSGLEAPGEPESESASSGLGRWSGAPVVEAISESWSSPPGTPPAQALQAASTTKSSRDTCALGKRRDGTATVDIEVLP